MIRASDRKRAIELIDEAHQSGARKYKACEELGISVRTYQRWVKDGGVKEDQRPYADRPEPSNKLSSEEREEILETVNAPEFKSLPPSQIVPALADQGRYLASESTIYRILKEHDQQHHRGRSAAPKTREVTTYCATKPNEVWCWDITWLPGPAKGFYFYLYLIIDLFSRKIVGWEIHAEESSDAASLLVVQTHLKEKVAPNKLILHSDNGSPMKGASLMETLHNLDISSSYSRPRVSNDNAYAESIFKTCKYRPDYPYNGFATIHKAREWVHSFATWYNEHHHHSGLKFMTPNQVHSGQSEGIEKNRKEVYEAAKRRNPNRWSGETRNWTPGSAVFLNPSTSKPGKVEK